MPPRVLVIGSGIAGLCAAVGLRQAGLDVAVFEKRTDPRELAFGGGMTIWNNAMRALGELGLAEAVEAIGTPIERAEWRTIRDDRLLATWPVEDVSREVGAPAVCVRRLNLQKALTDAYGEDGLELGVECTGFREDADGVTALFAGGREERGDLLIGADGLSSAVRFQLHGATKPRYAGYGIWFGTSGEVTQERIWREIDGPAARFIYFPVDGGRVYWSCIANAPEADVLQAAGEDLPGEKEKVLARYRGWPAPVEDLIRVTEPGELFRRPIVDRNPIKNWGAGRVTLMGDAAHPLTINLGQGACQAIEDALILTRSVTANGDLPAALRAYEEKRASRVSSFTWRARMIGSVSRWKNPVACRVRDRAAAWLLPGLALKQHRNDMKYEF